MKKALTILGAGAWGTALAFFFGSKGYHVYLWCYEAEIADSINNNHVNMVFLPSVRLPETVYALTDIDLVLSYDVDFVIEAVPVSYLRVVIGSISCPKAAAHYWVLTSKGLEQKTGYHSLRIMEEIFGKEIKTIILAGPSFASELIQAMPTACVAATKDKKAYALFASYWQSSYTALYYSKDLDGVLLCSALKNIVALLLGLIEGAGYGKNTQSFLLTIAYQEIKKCITFFKGDEETVSGLAGFGDLFLTVSTNVSKNRMYGYLHAQGKSVDEIYKQIPVLPEGISTAAGFQSLCRALNICEQDQFPLLCSVYYALVGKISIKTIIRMAITIYNK